MLIPVEPERIHRRSSPQQRRTPARNHSFVDGRAGGVQGVLDARLLLLQLDFRGRADLDDGDPTREFGQTLGVSLQESAFPGRACGGATISSIDSGS